MVRGSPTELFSVGICALPCATPAIRLYNLDGLGRDGPRYTVTTHVLPKLCCKATAASRTWAGARAGLRPGQPAASNAQHAVRSALSAVRTATKLMQRQRWF